MVKGVIQGGMLVINKFSLYSVSILFVFIGFCSILVNYYRANIKKYLYYEQEKSVKYFLLWTMCSNPAK
jgi:hypothetical protein